SLQSHEYLKYEIENNSNFKINNNKLIISNLNFYIDGVLLSKSDFTIGFTNYTVPGPSNTTQMVRYKISVDNGEPDYVPVVKGYNGTKKKIIFPEKITDEPIDLIYKFSNNSTESVDMSALNTWAGFASERPNVNPGVLDFKSNRISNSMFYEHYYLKKVILPKNTKEIGAYAFFKCQNLKKINLPNSLNVIEEYAFNSSGLESLVIPPSVITLGRSIFYSVYSTQWVKISSIIPNIDPNTFVTNKSNKITIYVPTQELKNHYDDLVNKNKLNNIKEIIVGEPPAN
ncbi:MAG: leucine-rich repeat domain-containing protein, partial [Ureaplasma sp.]|nr:leucine-rich repeat domain-containing protein [Ureaplasma sp.]